MIGLVKKKIMLVDDEEDIRNAVKSVLEDEGYEVMLANGGKEALEKLKTVKPDLVLIDFFMPKLNGLDLCKQIRMDSKLKKLNCAFLTVAIFNDEKLKELNKLNVLDYIQKPVTNEELVRRIKKGLKN